MSIRSIIPIVCIWCTIQLDAQNIATQRLKYGGRIQYDIEFLHQPILPTSEIQSELRRLRLYAKGIFYDNIRFKLDVGFATGKTVPKDVFLQLNNLPKIGHIRIGHFKRPFRFQALLSSNHIGLMERSLHMPFLPVRGYGIMTYNKLPNQHLSWQFAAFFADQMRANTTSSKQKIDFSARLAWLPYLNPKAQRMLHFALAYSSTHPTNNLYELGFRPSAHLSPKYLETALEHVETAHLVNAELAMVIRSFNLQVEYLQSAIIGPEAPAQQYPYAFYTQLSYFLTGEHKTYKNSLSGYAPIKPKNNFDSKGGFGAWEIVIRYESVKLNTTQALSDLIFGLNWYLNPATRFMINYNLYHFNPDNTSGTLPQSLLQMRFQVYF